MERRTPVARIVPVGLATDGGEEAARCDEEAKLARLEQARIVERRTSGRPLEVRTVFNSRPHSLLPRTNLRVSDS